MSGFMFQDDQMELLRLRVGIGPETLAEARWAIVTRRHTDGEIWISHLGGRLDNRSQCIRDFVKIICEFNKNYKWPADPYGFTDRKYTCERVVVAFNYREKNGP